MFDITWIKNSWRNRGYVQSIDYCGVQVTVFFSEYDLAYNKLCDHARFWLRILRIHVRFSSRVYTWAPHLPFLSWARRWLDLVLQKERNLRLPPQPHSVAAHWPLPNYTAWSEQLYQTCYVITNNNSIMLCYNRESCEQSFSRVNAPTPCASTPSCH